MKADDAAPCSARSQSLAAQPQLRVLLANGARRAAERRPHEGPSCTRRPERWLLFRCRAIPKRFVFFRWIRIFCALYGWPPQAGAMRRGRYICCCWISGVATTDEAIVECSDCLHRHLEEKGYAIVPGAPPDEVDNAAWRFCRRENGWEEGLNYVGNMWFALLANPARLLGPHAVLRAARTNVYAPWISTVAPGVGCAGINTIPARARRGAPSETASAAARTGADGWPFMKPAQTGPTRGPGCMPCCRTSSCKDQPEIERLNVVCHYQNNLFYEGTHVSQTRPLAGFIPHWPRPRLERPLLSLGENPHAFRNEHRHLRLG